MLSYTCISVRKLASGLGLYILYLGPSHTIPDAMMFTILFQQDDVVDEIKEMKEEHVVELVCSILSSVFANE